MPIYANYPILISVSMALSKCDIFFYFLSFIFIYTYFLFLSSFNSLQLIHTSTTRLCMVQVYLLPPHPRATPGTSPALRARGWGSCPGGRGLGQIKNYLLFDFAQYVSFLVLFTRWLRTSRLRIFKEKRRNFSESGWRGITYQN